VPTFEAMRRRSAALSLLGLCAFCALASISASATRPPDADIVSVDTYPFSSVVKWHVDDAALVPSPPARDANHPELGYPPRQRQRRLPTNGVAPGSLRVFREGRIVKPLGDLVTDKLPALGVAVHIVPPPGW